MWTKSGKKKAVNHVAVKNLPGLHKETSVTKIGDILADEPSLLDTPTLAVQSINKDVEDELKL